MRLRAMLVYGYGDPSYRQATVDQNKKPPQVFGELLPIIDRAGKRPATLLFQEFAFTFKDAIEYAREIVAFTRRFECDVLMAPNNFFGREKWGAIKQQLAAAGIAIEETTLFDHSKPECVGLWFDRNGHVFGFPKELLIKNTHRIPGREEVGVSICAETDYLESMDGIRVLYNPSAFLYEPDVFLRGKNMLWYGVPEEVVIGECLLALSASGRAALTIEQIRAKLAERSAGLEGVQKLLIDGAILAIGCDNDKHSSGVVHLPDSARITDLAYYETHADLEIDF